MDTADNGITTETLSGTPSAYVRRVFVALMARWWWAWLLPPAVCFGAALHDAAWAFVGFMLLFLLYPGMLLFVYYHYAFSPEAVRTLRSRTLTVSRKKLTVTYTGDRPPAPETYTDADISDVETGRDTVVFYLRRPAHHHIAVPMSAVGDNEKERFLRLCDSFRADLA